MDRSDVDRSDVDRSDVDRSDVDRSDRVMWSVTNRTLFIRQLGDI